MPFKVRPYKQNSNSQKSWSKICRGGHPADQMDTLIWKSFAKSHDTDLKIEVLNQTSLKDLKTTRFLSQFPESPFTLTMVSLHACYRYNIIRIAESEVACKNSPANLVELVNWESTGFDSGPKNKVLLFAF